MSSPQKRAKRLQTLLLGREILDDRGLDRCRRRCQRGWRHLRLFSFSLLAFRRWIKGGSLVCHRSCDHGANADWSNACAAWCFEISMAAAVEIPVCGRKWGTTKGSTQRRIGARGVERCRVQRRLWYSQTPQTSRCSSWLCLIEWWIECLIER